MLLSEEAFYGRKSRNIAGAATTAIKATYLCDVIVNKWASSATITLYDGVDAGGVKLATITLSATQSSECPFGHSFNVACATGIAVVTSGATDITITYR